MFRIAIIQFPGLNTEYETRREINRCGMRAEFFRWNDFPEKLTKYDGYVIGGGFSYEDRGRAGIIASLEPIMQTLKKEAEKGKPLLGICNGAQILVESGLIPGTPGNKLAMALARNKRIQDGEILGTGYYNSWVYLKCVAEKEKCMFMRNFSEGEIIRAPVAHAEGRFTTELPDLFPQLQNKGQMVFRYCNREGVTIDNFPINPNGAAYNLAALCNPEGNIMAVMPHLEREGTASEKLFTSLRDSLEARKMAIPVKRNPPLQVKTLKLWPLAPFQKPSRSLEFFISLIITDNEAETFQMTLKNLGFPKVSLRRSTLVSLEYQKKPDLQKLARKLIQSGVLLNTHKEWTNVQFVHERLEFDAKREKFVPAVEPVEELITFKLLIQEKPDFIGLSKLSTLQKRLKFEEITSLTIGTLWKIHIPTKSQKTAEGELKRMLATHLFFNPHRQAAFLVN